MSASPDTKTFPCAMESLAGIQQFVADRITAAGLTPETAASAELVVEEIAVNIIKYGGKSAPAGEIGIRLDLQDQIVLEISDNGRPFNPLDSADPDTGLGVEERQVGGLGIFLVKQMARDISYSRHSGLNCLRITL